MGDSASIRDGDSPEQKDYGDSNHTVTPTNSNTGLTEYVFLRFPGTCRDQELLHHYCTTTRQALSQYPRTEFWTSTVLQLSTHEPVIRRCLIAYSCSHRQYIMSRRCNSNMTSGGSGDDGYSRQIMPLTEYNNSLRILRRYIATAPAPQFSRKVILISIAILYAAARSIGKLEDAKTHLRAALEILDSWIEFEQRSGQTSRFSSDLASLLEIVPSSYMNENETEDTTTVTCSPIIANKFQNAIQAQMVLETIQSRFFRFIVMNRKPACHAPPLSSSFNITVADDNHQLPPFVHTEIVTLEKNVAFWRSSFQEVLDMSSPNQPSGVRGPVRYHTALLYAQYWTLSALIRSSMRLLHGQRPSTPETNAHAGRVLSLLKTNFIFPSAQAMRKEKTICKPSATPELYLELAQQREFAMQSKAIEMLTDTLNHEDMTNVLRVLDLLMVIGRKESHPFYNRQKSPESPEKLVAAQRALERLILVLDERKF